MWDGGQRHVEVHVASRKSHGAKELCPWLAKALPAILIVREDCHETAVDIAHGPGSKGRAWAPAGSKC